MVTLNLLPIGFQAVEEGENKVMVKNIFFKKVALPVPLKNVNLSITIEIILLKPVFLFFYYLNSCFLKQLAATSSDWIR